MLYGTPEGVPLQGNPNSVAYREQAAAGLKALHPKAGSKLVWHG